MRRVALISKHGSASAGDGRTVVAAGGTCEPALPAPVSGARDNHCPGYRSSADRRTLLEPAAGCAGSVRPACSGTGELSHR